MIISAVRRPLLDLGIPRKKQSFVRVVWCQCTLGVLLPFFNTDPLVVQYDTPRKSRSGSNLETTRVYIYILVLQSCIMILIIIIHLTYVSLLGIGLISQCCLYFLRGASANWDLSRHHCHLCRCMQISQRRIPSRRNYGIFYKDPGFEFDDLLLERQQVQQLGYHGFCYARYFKKLINHCAPPSLTLLIY